MAVPSDDRQLVYGLRTGDPESHVALLSQYGDVLVRFLTHVCRVADADAEDLAVETLYRAIERIDQFHDRPGSGPNALRNWLLSIGRNLWRDQLRRRWREVHLDEWDQLGAVDLDGDDMTVTPAVAALHLALASLPEKQRLTLVLFYGGSSLSDVAAILRAPEGTVRQWKRRGLAALAAVLKDEVAFERLLPKESSHE